MQSEALIEIHFKNIEPDEEIRDIINLRCKQLSVDFPEAMRFEIHLTPDGRGCSARAHAVGRKLDIAVNHEWASDLGPAAAEILDKLESRLRSHHDKKRMGVRRRTPKPKLET
jgi:ribosome-associated translation inhibitor RaiA